ncbi:MAG: hypothetical protein GY729_22620, partial [Desulfobacteraceae bacterium]|nr:hypothetical protein [Desulfobacteraceae bacterium]
SKSILKKIATQDSCRYVRYDAKKKLEDKNALDSRTHQKYDILLRHDIQDELFTDLKIAEKRFQKGLFQFSKRPALSCEFAMIKPYPPYLEKNIGMEIPAKCIYCSSDNISDYLPSFQQNTVSLFYSRNFKDVQLSGPFMINWPVCGYCFSKMNNSAGYNSKEYNGVISTMEKEVFFFWKLTYSHFQPVNAPEFHYLYFKQDGLHPRFWKEFKKTNNKYSSSILMNDKFEI